MINRKIYFLSLLFFLIFFACNFPTSSNLSISTQPSPTDSPLSPTPIKTVFSTPTAAATEEIIITPTIIATKEAKPSPTPTEEIAVFKLSEFPKEQLSIGDPYTPELGNLGYDVQEYHLQIRVDPSNPNFFESEISITAVSDFSSLEYVSLDLVGFTVHNVEVNDDDVQFLRTQYKLLIKLNESLEIDEEFLIYVHYSGFTDDSQTPYSFIKFSQGAIFPSERTMIVISEPDGARKVFPCNDHMRDKAIFKVDIITPADLIGVSNGQLYNTQLLDTNEIMHSWISNDEMAPYLLTIAVGDFVIDEYIFDNGLIVRNYVLPDTHFELDGFMQILNEAMTHFENLFGPYPFDTYGYVLHLIEGVSLESQSTIALSSSMIDENTLVHELIHMWFGNWVSLDSWGEIWRNEGFATYFAKSWLNRDTPNTYINYMESLYFNTISRDDLNSLGDLPTSEMFSYESYAVGSLVVYRLKKTIGDDAFFSGIQDYFAIYGGGSASDQEFQAVMENACTCSLDEFFNFWLEP